MSIRTLLPLSCVVISLLCIITFTSRYTQLENCNGGGDSPHGERFTKLWVKQDGVQHFCFHVYNVRCCVKLIFVVIVHRDSATFFVFLSPPPPPPHSSTCSVPRASYLNHSLTEVHFHILIPWQPRLR